MSIQFIEASLYQQILENIPIACVDIAIVDQGAVLLLKRKDPPARGQWWLPGGRVLKGEMMRETAQRKAREEVGMECHVGQIIHTAETILPDGPAGVSVHNINSCFLLHPAGPASHVKLDKHHEEYRWVDHIPDGLHPYIEDCLSAAGLAKRR